MKKVGILTTFRQPNWGSVLQAYALQKVIKDFGYDVENIDYKYPNSFHWERGLKWGRPLKKNLFYYIRKVKSWLLCSVGICARPMMDLMNTFIEKEIKVSKPILSYEALHSNPPIYDIYVSGSDQIWNPNTMMGDMSYLFDFVSDKEKKVAYASSFSCLSIPEAMTESYKHYLLSFHALSVREENGKKIINELLGRKAEVVLDPTLLLPKTLWKELANRAHKVRLPKQYILCYMLAYTFDVDEPMSQLLHVIQEKYNMPVIALNALPQAFAGQVFQLPKSYSRGIEEFLYLIDNASIVVSSSFHGTAFSLNFGKPLVAMGARNEDDRVWSLLDSLDMKEQFIYSDQVSQKEINAYYELDVEQKKLQNLRNKSLLYLKNALA